MAAAVCAALGASTATSAVGDEALDEASSAEAGEAASVDLGAAPPWGPKDAEAPVVGLATGDVPAEAPCDAEPPQDAAPLHRNGAADMAEAAPSRWWWSSPTPPAATDALTDGARAPGARGSAAAERAPRAVNRAVLRLLCFLGDAGVTDTESGDCQQVVAPPEYVEICGRWQCSDPRVDRCYFSDVATGLAEPRTTQASEEALPAASAPQEAQPAGQPPTKVATKAARRWLRRRGPPRCAAEATPRLAEAEVCLAMDAHLRSLRGQCAAGEAPEALPGHAASQAPAEAEAREEPPGAPEHVSYPPSRSRPSPCRAGGRCCRPADALLQCDAFEGWRVSQIWGSIGVSLAAKLRPKGDIDVKPNATVENGTGDAANGSGHRRDHSGRWRHCAEELQLCMCAGEVRFGNGQHWASEVLHTRQGILSCTAGFFGGADALPELPPRFCECLSPRPRGPLVLPSNETSAAPIAKQSDQADVDGLEGRFIRSRPYLVDFLNGVRYDYASMGAGARLVTHAKTMKNAKAVLSPDKSEYMLVPCHARTWFVVSLLEDLFLEQVGLMSLELFASGFRHLQILGSSKYPTEMWRLLGEVESNATAPYELFDVGARCRRQTESCWVRYIKVRVLSHHEMEDNSFCALTRFQAFGSTQMTYIAEEVSAENAIDRRVEPSVADVAQWHDHAAQAVRKSLSELVGEERVNDWEQAVRTTEGSRHEDHVHGAHGVGEGAHDHSPVVYKPTQKELPLHEKPLAFLKKALSWIRDHTTRKIPGAPAGQADPSEDAAHDGRPGGEIPLDAEADRAADAERTERLSRSGRVLEMLSELNGTGSLSVGGAGLASLKESISRLGALASEAGGAAGAASAAAPPGAAAGAPPAPAGAKPNKTGSNVPAVVKMHNDLRGVQTDQAMLKDDLRSVTSVLRETLVLLLEVVLQHSDGRAQMAQDEHQGRQEEFGRDSAAQHIEVLRLLAEYSDDAALGPWLVLFLVAWIVRLEILVRRTAAPPCGAEQLDVASGALPPCEDAAVQRAQQGLLSFSPLRSAMRGPPPLELPEAQLAYPGGQALAPGERPERRRPSRGFRASPPVVVVPRGERSSSCSSEPDSGRRRREPNSDDMWPPASPSPTAMATQEDITSSDSEDRGARRGSWHGAAPPRLGPCPQEAAAPAAYSTAMASRSGPAQLQVMPTTPSGAPVGIATPSQSAAAAAIQASRRAPKRFSSTARRHIRLQARRERDSGASG